MATLQNAVIKSVTLGFRDDNPQASLTAWLHLGYGNEEQGFGGFRLRGNNAEIFLTKCLHVAGANRWERLPGRPIRVECEGVNLVRIVHCLDDTIEFNPSKTLD